MKAIIAAVIAVMSLGLLSTAVAGTKGDMPLSSAMSNVAPNNQKSVTVQRHDRLGGKAVGGAETMTVEKLTSNRATISGNEPVLVTEDGGTIVSASTAPAITVADYANFKDCLNGAVGSNQRSIAQAAFNPKGHTVSDASVRATGIVGKATCVAASDVS